jgi:hypothetical protein
VAEEELRFYSGWVPIVNVRMSNLCGLTPLERCELIHVLIHRLLCEASAEVVGPRRARVHLRGGPAEATTHLPEAEHTCTLNFGTGTSMSVARVVEMLKELWAADDRRWRRERAGLPLRTNHTRPVDRLATALLDRAGHRRTFEMVRAMSTAW